MSNSISPIRKGVYIAFFGLAAIEGLAVLLITLQVPSVGRISFANGHSSSQSILVAVSCVLVFIFSALAVRSLFDSRWLEEVSQWLEKHLEYSDRLLILSLTLLAGWALAVLLLGLWQLPVIREYRWYASVFRQSLHLYEILLVLVERIYPLLVWGAALLLQTLLALVLLFSDRYRQAGFWNLPVISRTILVLSMLGLSFIQWSILAMQISVKALIPGWYWDVYQRPFSARHLAFLGIAAISIGLITYLLKHPDKVITGLVLLTGLGCFIVFSFGFIQGQGSEYVRLKYAGTNHRSYVLIATGENPDPLRTVTEYEQRYGLKMFPSTKPPGVVLFYVVLEKLVNTIQPYQTSEGRFLTFTRWATFIFPVVSFFVLWVLYFFVRTLVRREDAFLPSMLYIFAPNVILFPLFLDQVLYPLLFLTSFVLLYHVVRRRKLWLAVLAGLYIYIAIFFTFSLLTLIPLFLVLLGLDYWLNYKERKILQSAGLAIGVGAGIIVLFVLFRIFLNYDFFQRYDTAMRVVRNFDFILRTGQKATVDLATATIQPSLGQILRAAFLNNTELAAAVGFPIFLLFLWRSVRTVISLVRRRATSLDFALGAMCLTYLALNLYGQVQGEVSRLWIFWVPMIVTFAGVELATQFKRRALVVNFVVLLQLITILMIFQFQDFLV
jgi:hypothetical protein